MKIKKRSDIQPASIEDSEMKGVKFYPLITSRDGAPNFALRVFEVGPNGYSPKHSHEWEHEIYIISGDGNVLTKSGKVPIEKDHALLIEPHELHQIQAGERGIAFICVVPHQGQP